MNTGWFSVLSLRNKINEAQNNNYEHNNILQVYWTELIKAGCEEESVYENLRKRYQETLDNHKIILAGQSYLNEVEQLYKEYVQ